MSDAKTAIAKAEPKGIALVANFGKVYCKVQGGKFLSAVQSEMTLYKDLGHFYSTYTGKDRKTNEWIIKTHITAQGYRHLNRVPAISIVQPQSVVVDGCLVPNPHIERDAKTRAILSVNLRKMGIGYSPLGNIVVVDKTLFFNVYTYLIQDVQKKMKDDKKEKNGKDGQFSAPAKKVPCGIYGIASKAPGIDGSWYFLPTEGELGIWINYEDRDIIDCLNEHTQRQRFGDRIAQTIVERNILKDHPAIAVSEILTNQSGDKATVTVYGFRNDLRPQDLNDIMTQAEQDGNDGKYEVKKETITQVDADDERAARAAEAEAEENEQFFGSEEEKEG